MNRPLAFICALLLTFVTISSVCVAQPAEWVHFTLDPERGSPAKIHARFDNQNSGRGDNSWSTGLAPSELIGLDVHSFRGSGTHPLRFAIIRETGRLDCSGSGGDSHADGNCRFAADPAFTQLLITRGIGRPTSEQALGLMAVNAHREVIDAVAAARYPAPSIAVARSAMVPSGESVLPCIRTTPMVCTETGAAVPMTATSISSPSSTRPMSDLRGSLPRL